MATEPGLAQMRLAFRSDPFAVRDALSKSRETWVEWGLLPDICATAEQVLAEVLNNVVEHAHQEDPNGAVEITCETVSTGLQVEVRDDGCAMPGLALPEGALAACSDDLMDLPEGGFGWFLIRTLTEDLSYDRRGDWNTVRFRIPSSSDLEVG